MDKETIKKYLIVGILVNLASGILYLIMMGILGLITLALGSLGLSGWGLGILLFICIIIFSALITGFVSIKIVDWYRNR